MVLPLNTLIDSRYILSRYLASGGMADIYEAQDVFLNKPVALKFIKDKYLESNDSIEQFKNEARYTSIFNHPNIMKIYNVGEIDNHPYVSYELLKGKTLKEVLDNRGKLSLDEVIDYMLQILSGSEEIHNHGILHNDFKPDNLCLLFDGSVKIVDFGAATHILNKSEKQILGTANYLAPEVITNKKYSVQSDIYSLGIIFYELLTGELPFVGANSEEIIAAHQKADIVYLDNTSNIKNINDLNYVINKAIARNLTIRYKNDREFINDINKIRHKEEIKKDRAFRRIFK